MGARENDFIKQGSVPITRVKARTQRAVVSPVIPTKAGIQYATSRRIYY